MREILFRGKRVDNGEWVYGNYHNHSIEKSISFYKVFVGTPMTMYAVIPESIGQYTGLKDKNGKRIFEGDVIKDDKHLYLIEWYAGDFDAGFLPFICSENCRAVRSCNCEIIGDIHDNPELLEGENNG